MQYIELVWKAIFNFFKDHLGKVSAHTLGWVTILLLHFSSVPTLMAVLMAKSDVLPPVDIMVFVWTALIAMFFKALIEKNALYITTICLGFAAQTVLMTLILFK